MFCTPRKQKFLATPLNAAVADTGGDEGCTPHQPVSHIIFARKYTTNHYHT